jgi:hypothetical protein
MAGALNVLVANKTNLSSQLSLHLFDNLPPSW